jgi:lipopolysaccharide/colanic/teichoic acid biosynthesis glycosyltransferase
LNRLTDIAGSLIGLVLLSPLFLTITALVKLQDGGPVLYRSMRVGRAGVPLGLIKFRTMVPHADRLGGGITVAQDPRVTPIGRLLRKSKLDELPQLWNVLCGEMSFIGPRPEDPRYVARYTPDHRRVLRFTPGITSPASVHYRHEERLLTAPDSDHIYLERILPDKIMLDLEYFTRRTLFTDVLLIARTLRELFK